MTAPRIDRAALRSIVAALIRGEVGRAVDDGPPHPWSDALKLGEGGMELDSLHRVHVAAAVGEMFQLADGDAPTRAPACLGDWLDIIERAQPAGAGYLQLRTSGSTGRQRPCRHAIADLQAEAGYFAALLADRQRVIALVPAHHIYGLIWTVLLPSVLSIPVVRTSFQTLPPLVPGDLIVAVPDGWQALQRVRSSWPADVIGASAGAPLDDELAEQLALSGVSRLIDIYGSSETGGVALRDAPGGNYTLLPRWAFAEPQDFDAPRLVDRAGHEIPLPDRICAAGDGFRVAGRIDGAVQIGGSNVWPQQVAAILRRCAGVADVAVRLSDCGRLKAFVVPQGGDDADDLRGRLADHARARLAAIERPIAYRFGSALPRNDMGKAADWD